MKRRKISLLFLTILLMVFVTGCNSGNVSNTEKAKDTELIENAEIADTSQDVKENTEIADTSQEVKENTEIADTSQETKEEQEIEVEVGIPDEELSLMQKVLFNKAPYNGEEKIANVEGIYNDEYGRAVTFCMVDLDHDGNEEVCLIYGGGSVFILHYDGNEVFGYDHAWRTFHPVYEDGTFRGSSGAAYSEFYGNCSFTKDEFYFEPIITAEYSGDGNITYYKNGWIDDGERIDQEEYDQIMSQYEMIEVEEYEFTVENVLEYVK